MAILKRWSVVSASAVAALTALAVWPGGLAAGGLENWQTGFREPASPTMEMIHWFNDWFLFPVAAGITVFVLGLLAYVILRFSEKRNPTPRKFTHNTTVEVLWTVIPVIILVVIAVPSFRLLYFADRIEDADMTIKAIGRQWYWSYEYPDHGNFTFDALMVAEEDLEEGQKRLLTTDAAVVLPVDTRIRLLITASDVLHSFALPSMGIKVDAVPGRVNETWVEITKEGTYYGQCSEICGTGHSYMPIMVKAVSKEAFAEWAEQAREEYAALDSPRPQPAAGAAETGEALARLAAAQDQINEDN